MKIHQYNQMMKYLTRPKNKLSFNERKAITDEFYKKGGSVPEAKPKPKPMPILKYISKMNSLYGNGGSVKPETPHGTEPDYYDPVEFEDIKKSLNVSPMVKKPKKKIIKKTLIVEKPKKKTKPITIAKKPKPPIIELLEHYDQLNLLDPLWWEEVPDDDDKVLLRVPRRKLAGIASLLDVG